MVIDFGAGCALSLDPHAYAAEILGPLIALGPPKNVVPKNIKRATWALDPHVLAWAWTGTHCGLIGRASYEPTLMG